MEITNVSPLPLPLPPPFTHTHPAPTLITQGAEALLYRTHFLRPAHPCALKHRPAKAYRHPTLDKRLTRHRILSEARTLVKCRREGVSVPGVLALDAEAGWMLMEWVEGRTVKEVVVAAESKGKKGEGEQERNGEGKGEAGEDDGLRVLMGKIGRAVGRMHEVGVVHGDLTTSNMMLVVRPSQQSPPPLRNDGRTDGEGSYVGGGGRLEEVEEEEGEIVLIDFGLAAQSLQDEDKAVDLYVLERAFGSTHPEAEAGFREVLRAYGESYRGAKVVLRRLEDVRLRGRKRSMLG